jgi:hypothetical protein
MNNREQDKSIENKNRYKETGSDKASQLGPSSPSERKTDQPQTEGYRSSADNDFDRVTTNQNNLQEDADEAQSDGNISFPEGK